MPVKKTKCLTRYCRRAKAPGRNYCHTCRMKRHRRNNPFNYVYNVVKQNAKRRGIEFGITPEQFKAWCIENNYLNDKGQRSHSATIDRVKNERGYFIDNIQVLTLADNVRKMYVDYGYKFKMVRYV